MINWLIRTLGGFTQEEHNELLRRSSEAHQMMVSAKIAEVEALREQLRDYRADRQFYQDKLFPAQEARKESSDARLEPIQMSRIPWTRRKFMLERADRLKLEAEKQVSQTEKAILEKNRRVQEQENAS